MDRTQGVFAEAPPIAQTHALESSLKGAWGPRDMGGRPMIDAARFNDATLLVVPRSEGARVNEC